MAEAIVLRGALDVLRTKGWIRGRYKSDDGYCLAGAFNATRSHRLLESRAREYRILEETCQEVSTTRPGRCSIPYFNDVVARDFSDIEAVMEKAILRYEEEVVG